MSSPPCTKQRRGGVPAAAGSLLRSALVEVRPRLQAAYCFLRLAADTDHPAFRLLSVQASGDHQSAVVCVTLQYRGDVYEEHVAVPQRMGALSGPVACEGRHVTFRIRLEPDSRRGSAAAEVVAPENSGADPAPEPPWRPETDSGRVYSVSCQRCRHVLVQRSFRRALPLPSDNWREMLGNVFCHGDGTDADLHQRLRARSGDCFYTAAHSVLAPTDLTGCVTKNSHHEACSIGGLALGDAAAGTGNGNTPAADDSTDDRLASALPAAPARAEDDRLMCASCDGHVGERVEFGARLWHHLVAWTGHDVAGMPGVPELRLQTGQVLRCLLTDRAAAGSQTAACVRLLASAPTPHQPLLLWLLESPLTVYEATEGQPSATSRTALKILWRTCDEQAAKQHRADLQVSAIELDDCLMVTLLAELRDSLRWYPESQRTVGADKVGLILL